jgi:hypothetical protein
MVFTVAQLLRSRSFAEHQGCGQRGVYTRRVLAARIAPALGSKGEFFLIIFGKQ